MKQETIGLVLRGILLHFTTLWIMTFILVIDQLSGFEIFTGIFFGVIGIIYCISFISFKELLKITGYKWLYKKLLK